MILYLLILALPILIFYFAPEVYFGLILEMVTVYRNWQGRRKLKLVEEELTKMVEAGRLPRKGVEEFLLKHGKQIIETEGNNEMKEVFKNAHPIVKSSFPQDRLWVYGFRREMSKSENKNNASN